MLAEITLPWDPAPICGTSAITSHGTHLLTVLRRLGTQCPRNHKNGNNSSCRHDTNVLRPGIDSLGPGLHSYVIIIKKNIIRTHLFLHPKLVICRFGGIIRVV